VDSHRDVPTRTAHLALTLPTVEDLGRDASAGEPNGVDAIEVVVADAPLEVALEAGEAHVQVASEGRAPALLEDRLVQGRDGPFVPGLPQRPLIQPAEWRRF
jgi:hypothetical protein